MPPCLLFSWLGTHRVLAPAPPAGRSASATSPSLVLRATDLDLSKQRGTRRSCCCRTGCRSSGSDCDRRWRRGCPRLAASCASASWACRGTAQVRQREAGKDDCHDAHSDGVAVVARGAERYGERLPCCNCAQNLRADVGHCGGGARSAFQRSARGPERRTSRAVEGDRRGRCRSDGCEGSEEESTKRQHGRAGQQQRWMAAGMRPSRLAYEARRAGRVKCRLQSQTTGRQRPRSSGDCQGVCKLPLSSVRRLRSSGSSPPCG